MYVSSFSVDFFSNFHNIILNDLFLVSRSKHARFSNMLTGIVKPFHKDNLQYSTDSWYLHDGVKLLNFRLTSTR